MNISPRKNCNYTRQKERTKLEKLFQKHYAAYSTWEKNTKSISHFLGYTYLRINV